MKTYRRPFYKTHSFVPLVVMLITMACLLPTIVEHFNIALANGISVDYLIKVSVLIGGMGLSVIVFIDVYNNFYIKMSDSRIAIVNGIIPFIRRSFELSEIAKCEIGNAGGLSLNYIRVTNIAGVRTLPYVIDMVPREDYEEIIDTLTSRGIEVEIVGILK